MEQAIIKAISEVAGKNVNPGNSFSYLGIDDDSKRGQLAMALNEKFNISITISDINRCISVKKLIDYITPLIEAQSNSVSETYSSSITVGMERKVGKESDENIQTESQTVSTADTSSNNAKPPILEYKKKYDWAVTPDKSKHKIVIGIDFGHGETSAAYCVIGWGGEGGTQENVKDIELENGSHTIPSAITIDSKGNAFIGNSAFEPNHLRDSIAHVHFKQKPKDINGQAESLMAKYMSEIYKLICEKNPGTFNKETEDHVVYIATPSGWEEEYRELYGRMAFKAGLPIAGIVSESKAAFIKAQQETDTGLPQYVEKGAIVFDMGSSTLDFTYLRRGLDESIDWGDNCGASEVEKIMYERKLEKSDTLQRFVEKYPSYKDVILQHARRCKEDIYSKAPDTSSKGGFEYDLEDIVPFDEEFAEESVKIKYLPKELTKLLEEKGYVDKIRNAMQIMKNDKLNGLPIYAAFLTGGASRMHFIRDLVKECWDLPDDRIPKDNAPSLMISRGIALFGRIDILSGGSTNKDELLNQIVESSKDLFSPFAKAFTEKVTNEMQSSVVTAFNEFKDSNTDLSLNDLQIRMGEWIEQDTANISKWATECYIEVFEERTASIRERLDSIVNKFSNSRVKIGSVGSVSLSLPQLDMNDISDQMKDIGVSFAKEASSISEAVTDIAITSAVGFGLGLLVGGPLAWVLLGGYLAAKWLFGEEETEEEKKRKAIVKDLNSATRLQIYNAFFNEKWDEVANKIATNIHQAVYGNEKLKNRINSQSEKVIREYAQECIYQTGSILD